MRLSRTFILATVSLLMFCLPIHAQRLDVKGIRKKSKAVDCATVVFKSDFDCLSIIGMSPFIERRDVTIAMSGRNM